MEDIKKSAAIVMANQEHYRVIDKYAREMFLKYCEQKPVKRDVWRGYENVEVLDEDNIKISFAYGGGDMEFCGEIFVNLNTQIISEV